MKVSYFFLTFAIFCLTTTLQAQQATTSPKIEVEEQFQQILSLVQSNRFMVTIDRVYPHNGMDMSRFNPRGSIMINDSIAKGTLPFFGRAYSLPLGESGGIEFDSPIKERIIKIKDKKRNPSVTYRFTVAGKNDNYQIFIQVAPGGSCMVNLNSNKRAAISYSGQVTPLKEE